MNTLEKLQAVVDGTELKGNLTKVELAKILEVVEAAKECDEHHPKCRSDETDRLSDCDCGKTKLANALAELDKP